MALMSSELYRARTEFRRDREEFLHVSRETGVTMEEASAKVPRRAPPPSVHAWRVIV